MYSKPPKTKGYNYVELAGLLPDGKMVRDEYAQNDDVEAVDQCRDKFNNSDIFTSIMRYEKPDPQSDFIAPIFFDIDGPDNLKAARENTLVLCELIMPRLKIDSDQINICFSGSKGFHITIPCEVFEPLPSNLTLDLYKKMAANAQDQGVPLIDNAVYTNRRLWRLVNSINSKSGLYKIPLTHKELLHLSIKNIMELAKKPRCEDSFCIAKPNQHAIGWYKDALACMARLKTTPRHHKKHFATGFKNGWRVPPCIKKIQQSTLPDGIRHDTYLILARFYSWINMHPQEITETLNLLDKKNPIADHDIDRIVDWALDRPGFAGCNNQVLKKYCDKENCFYYSLKSRNTML